MDEPRCPECGATPSVEGARFCHECGAVLSGPEAPPIPDEPQSPEAPTPGRRMVLLWPAAAALVGIALLVVGALSGGEDSDPRPEAPLRAAGVLDTPAEVEVDLGPAPPGTVADFSADHSGTPTPALAVPSLEEWEVVLSEPFTDNARGWPIGEVGGTTRTIVGERYRVITEGGEGATIVFTWHLGIRPPVWFRLRADVAREGENAAACGLAVAGADGHPWIAVVADDSGQRYRALARNTSDDDIEVLLGWTELPDLIVPDRQNTLELIGRDDGIFIFLGDLAVARLPGPAFAIEQIGMVVRAPGGNTEAACEFDDLLVSWP